MIQIDFINDNSIADQARITEAAAAVYEYLNLSGSLIAELDFFNEDEIRVLNSVYRKINRATDVLSFPSLKLKPHDYPLFDKKNFPLDIAHGDVVMLGSIIICPEVMRQNAHEYGHGEDREFFYLLIHGLLHLLGFDHIKKSDKEIMRKAEEAVLHKIGLSIDQNNDE